LRVTLDNYSTATSERLEFICGRSADTLDLVRRLDGKTHTELCFDHPTGWTLIVGGGPSEFVTVKFNERGESYALINPTPVGAKRIDLCVGGQLGDFAPDVVCVFPAVADAIHEFFSAPSALTGLWRRD
jgi:hypothetical protein